MTRISRRAHLATAAGLGGALGTGCGVGPLGQSQTDTAPARALSGKLEVWMQNRFPLHTDLGNQFVREFQEKNPGVTVSYLASGDENVMQKLTVGIAAGDVADIIHDAPLFAPGRAVKGQLEELDQYLKKSRALTRADMFEEYIRDAVWEGKLYSIVIGGDVRCIYLNNKMFYEGGLDPKKPPKTWTQMEDAVRRLSRRSPSGEVEQLGFNLIAFPSGAFLWPFWQQGGEWLSKDSRKVTMADGDAALKAMDLNQRLIGIQGGWQAIKEFLIANDTFAATNPANAHFANHINLSTRNKVAMFLATFSDRNETLKKNFPDFQWEYTSFPIPDGGTKDANYGGSHGLVMPKLAKNKDAAWAWLEFVNSPENNLRFAVRYDRVPVRKSTAGSEAFLKGDPFLKLMIDQVKWRKFIMTGPFAEDVQPHNTVNIVDVVSGQMGARDAILLNARDVQQKIDKWYDQNKKV